MRQYHAYRNKMSRAHDDQYKVNKVGKIAIMPVLLRFQLSGNDDTRRDA